MPPPRRPASASVTSAGPTVPTAPTAPTAPAAPAASAASGSTVRRWRARGAGAGGLVWPLGRNSGGGAAQLPGDPRSRPAAAGGHHHNGQKVEPHGVGLLPNVLARGPEGRREGGCGRSGLIPSRLRLYVPTTTAQGGWGCYTLAPTTLLYNVHGTSQNFSSVLTNSYCLVVRS